MNVSTTETAVAPFAGSVFGWILYIGGALVCIGVVAYSLRATYILWRVFFRGPARAQRRLSKEQQEKRLRVGYVMQLLGCILYLLGALVFTWMFVALVLLSPPDVIRLDSRGVTALHRLPWRNWTVPWNQIISCQLKDLTTAKFGNALPKYKWHKVLTISTPRANYVVDPSTHGFDPALVRVYEAIQSNLHQRQVEGGPR